MTLPDKKTKSVTELKSKSLKSPRNGQQAQLSKAPDLIFNGWGMEQLKDLSLAERKIRRDNRKKV